jgi:hypothetical protein
MDPKGEATPEVAQVEAEAPTIAADAATSAAESAESAALRVLERVELPREAAEPAAAVPRLRTARLSRIERGHVFVRLRGHATEIEADVDEDVDVELLLRAEKEGSAVLVEEEPGMAPVVVGVVQTRIPDTLELKARKVIVEGEEEVLVRSGTGAMRIRSDGDVELVGSRIMTMSRGLFRLVGRMLRLN